jgi:hypothetical protein
MGLTRKCVKITITASADAKWNMDIQSGRLHQFGRITYSATKEKESPKTAVV